MPLKITLTGAAGRLGTQVAKHLLNEGHEVRAIDQVVRREPAVPIEVVNILNRESCYRILEGADAVVHLANHADDYFRDKQKLLTENLTMNTNMFQAARELGLKTVIFASSIQALGVGKRTEEGVTATLAYLPIDGDLPACPTNVYGLSKQLSEEMLRYYSREAGMNCVALRFPWLVEPSFRIRRHGPPHLRHLNEGWGHLSMNDASALIAAILKANVEGFRIYCPAARTNTANEKTTTLLESYFQNVPLKRPLTDEDGLFDISRITAETGWQPKDELTFE